MTHFRGKHGPYLIAEIGGNHEGDFDVAVRLTQLAIETDVDAVKFQVYTGDSLVNPKVNPERHAHFKRFELDYSHHIELAKLCAEAGVDFMASIWDIDAFDQLEPYLPIYKVGSGDLTAHLFLRRMAQSGKPIILSTGLSTMQEVLTAVDIITSVDAAYRDDQKLALLQCSSMYPIPDCDTNLNTMRSLAEATGMLVGYSDHTVGTLAIETAIAMGAAVIEAHFTESRTGKIFRDHKVSLVPDEWVSLIDRMKAVRVLQGAAQKRPTPSEIESGHVKSFRRAVYPAYDLPSRHVIAEQDLVVLRPREGIGAEELDQVVGKITKRAFARYEPFQWSDLSST